jgi:hypothetical protein
LRFASLHGVLASFPGDPPCGRSFRVRHPVDALDFVIRKRPEAVARSGRLDDSVEQRLHESVSLEDSCVPVARRLSPSCSSHRVQARSRVFTSQTLHRIGSMPLASALLALALAVESAT